MTLMHILAALAATVAHQMVGGLWYSVLFKNAWVKESGLDPNNIDKKAAMRGMMFALLFAFIVAMLLQFIMIHAEITGIVHMAGTGFTFAVIHALAIGTNYAYEGKSWKFWAINASYPMVGWSLMGVIFGLF